MGLPGKVFKSPMPFGDWDQEGHLLHDYHDVKASVFTIAMMLGGVAGMPWGSGGTIPGAKPGRGVPCKMWK